MEGRDNSYYDRRAQDVVKLEDITSSAHNAEILRSLRDNLALTDGSWDDLFIVDCDYNDENTFIVKEDDWGWLGYFIGRSKQIRYLHVNHLPEEDDEVDEFMKGICCNRSIEDISVGGEIKGVSITKHLAPFIMHNSKLKQLRLLNVDIDFDCARSLAMALSQRQEKTLTAISLCYNNLSNEALAEIIDALSGYKQLKSLHVEEELVERDEKYYEMLEQIIDLTCITSSEKNAEILRKLRDDEWDEETELSVDIFGVGEYFYPKEGGELGWLGYFIGRNNQIRELNVGSCLPEDDDHVDAFMKGLNRNRSIAELVFTHCDIDLGSLGSFIINNSNLRDLRLTGIEIGLESAQFLAMALNQRQDKSLSRVYLDQNNLTSDALAEIAAALSGYSLLESFSVSDNSLIGSGGCVSLGSIIKSAALHLKEVFFDGNDFNDEGLQTLAAALTNASNLRVLYLSKNRAITATGLRELSRLFHSDCPLETLHLEGMNIGDAGAEALADGLKGNTTLKHLTVSPHMAGITSVGWSAFSRLLCDTSSINNTYRSNHTLEHIGDDYDYDYDINPDRSLIFHSIGFDGIPSTVVRWVEINMTYRTQRAAKIKIGMCHPDIPVEVFFQHKLKFLPLIVSWFAGFEKEDLLLLSPNYRDCQNEFQERELSAIYKFIRAMPLPARDGQLRLKRSSGRKRKYDE